MNYLKSMFVVTLLLILPVLPAHALSMGRTGKAYQEGKVTWQDIYLEGNKFKISASIPGSPSTSFMNGACKIESDYQNTYYWVQTSSADDENPAKNAEAFVKQMGEYEGEFKQFKTKLKFVSYALNYVYKDENQNPGITRIWVTKHKVYVLGVLGKDLSLADAFFDSFEITQD
ncbi:MAG: hypothetical protein LLG04_05605 [Parachlamydia sp.]|nr:hypothetical protein [Parachlamydia sp.]